MVRDVPGRVTAPSNVIGAATGIIERMLWLAQVRTGDVAASPSNMAELVGEALRRMASQAGAFDAQILLPAGDDWPVALGYPAWIEEVWVNYISDELIYGGRPSITELEGSTFSSTLPHAEKEPS